MNICMVGTGYVGLVTGACLADFGMDVVCVDKDEDEDRARSSAGSIPIYEPGLEELIARNERAGRLRFTTDLKSRHRGARSSIFIAVGTPPKAGRLARPDLRPPGRRGDRRAHERLQGRRHEVDRADRHRPDDRADPPRRRTGGTSSRSSRTPSSCARARRSTTSCAPTGSSSAPATRAAIEILKEIYSPLFLIETPVRHHRRRLGRADQVRLERLPRGQDLLHQRDRPAVRADGRRRPRRGARAWGSTSGSAPSSCTPAPASAAPASRRTRPPPPTSRASTATPSRSSRRRSGSTTQTKARMIEKIAGAAGPLAGQDGRRPRPRRSSPRPTTSANRPPSR